MNRFYSSGFNNALKFLLLGCDFFPYFGLYMKIKYTTTYVLTI